MMKILKCLNYMYDLFFFFFFFFFLFFIFIFFIFFIFLEFLFFFWLIFLYLNLLYLNNFFKLYIILWLIALELMFFLLNMVFIFASIFLDDIMGQVYTLIFLLIIAGESAFAFTLLMAIVSLERTTNFNYIKNIKQNSKV